MDKSPTITCPPPAFHPTPPTPSLPSQEADAVTWRVSPSPCMFRFQGYFWPLSTLNLDIHTHQFPAAVTRRFE